MTAVAARLKLRNWLQLRRFFVVNRAVERQLETTSGLISYSRYDRIRARCDRACLAHQDGDGAPSEGLHFVDHEMGHRAELHREQPGQRHRGGSVASLYSGMSLASQPTDDTFMSDGSVSSRGSHRSWWTASSHSTRTRSTYLDFVLRCLPRLCDRADPARLFSSFDALGSRRTSDALLATFFEVVFLCPISPTSISPFCHASTPAFPASRKIHANGS